MNDVSVTIFEKATGSLSKHIAIDVDGRIVSDASKCRMWEGTARRAIANTATAFAEIVGTCTSRQALALGYLRDDLLDSVRVVTKAELECNPNSIARTRDFIFYRTGVRAWVLVDFDTKGMPPEIAARIQEAGGLWALLCLLIPGLASVAHVIRASTSAGLYNGETNETIAGSDGLHIYILINDGADAHRFLQNVHDRLWLAGFGWHVIGTAGQLLERSPVDRAVAAPEGLKFEGHPVLEPPLRQDAEKRRPIAYEGVAVDSAAVTPPLNASDQACIKEHKDTSAKQLKNDIAIVRRRYDNAHAEEISKDSGLPIETARRLVAQCRIGLLYPYRALEFDDLGVKTVAEVLADPESYIGCTLADPIEGIGYGRCKAMVMRGDDGTLFIHSFAHGRTIYQLRYDLRNATSVFESTPTVDRAVEILASTNFEVDEREQFRDVVAAATGCKVGVIGKRFKEAEQRRERERRRAAAEAEAASDRRISRPCPPANGALQSEIEFLDNTLAADRSSTPPMRDYNGKLIEVRLRAPFDLHMLTPEGEEKVEPPKELTICPLTATSIELLVEKHVRYVVETKNHSYAASLPRPFVTALNEYRNSALPILKVVNLSPLITVSGETVDGEGLDRDTGIFHHIDPRLRACFPTGVPTDEDVRREIDFLLNEWLVDVALDHAGKFLVIMAALSLIERSLLPERPAFFIVAGLRGSGKTTLAHMIAIAVLGHEAPAASWSDVDEERKKALFSLMRQGVPLIVWDNIRRGEEVSCPHIEASLTSQQMADRILGLSETETVSTAAIQVFTGNQIAPRGDMSSRSFVIALDADQPNPEARDFIHPAPLEWTRSNRFKIMRALYTILLAGAHNRPASQTAKTRFKTWYRLVGGPVESAAKLAGHDLDCDQLIKASEAVDTDVLGTTAVVNVLLEIWGTDPFTARDVVQKLPPEYMRSLADKQGLKLFDALSELLGKPLNRPTARSLAKLMRRRLIGHPVWLEGGVVATLRVRPDHDANEYWVELAHPKKAGQQPRPTTNNPVNPEIVGRSQVGTVRKPWYTGTDLSDPAFREKFVQSLRHASHKIVVERIYDRQQPAHRPKKRPMKPSRREPGCPGQS